MRVNFEEDWDAEKESLKIVDIISAQMHLINSLFHIFNLAPFCYQLGSSQNEKYSQVSFRWGGWTLEQQVRLREVRRGRWWAWGRADCRQAVGGARGPAGEVFTLLCMSLMDLIEGVLSLNMNELFAVLGCHNHLGVLKFYIGNPCIWIRFRFHLLTSTNFLLQFHFQWKSSTFEGNSCGRLWKAVEDCGRLWKAGALGTAPTHE